jgi:hypothetical protein
MTTRSIMEMLYLKMPTVGCRGAVNLEAENSRIVIIDLATV